MLDVCGKLMLKRGGAYVCGSGRVVECFRVSRKACSLPQYDCAVCSTVQTTREKVSSSVKRSHSLVSWRVCVLHVPCAMLDVTGLLQMSLQLHILCLN